MVCFFQQEIDNVLRALLTNDWAHMNQLASFLWDIPDLLLAKRFKAVLALFVNILGGRPDLFLSKTLLPESQRR